MEIAPLITKNVLRMPIAHISVTPTEGALTLMRLLTARAALASRFPEKSPNSGILQQFLIHGKKFEDRPREFLRGYLRLGNLLFIVDSTALGEVVMIKGVLSVLFSATVILVLGSHAWSGEVLDRVESSGVLRIPSEPGWPPYSFTDGDGNYTGFDVEVAEEIARRLNVKLQVVDKADGSIFTWEEQTGGNWGGAYDAVIGSMTPTAKRDENLDFPVVYYYGLGALAVHRDNTTITTPSEASGKRIGVLKSANYEYYARQEPFGIVGMEPPAYLINDALVVTYDSEDGPYDALEKGDGVELDGFINYLPTILALIQQGRPFKVVGKPLYRLPQAVAIEPGDKEFGEKLRLTVENMHEDGTLKRLSEKWFGLDMTTE